MDSLDIEIYYLVILPAAYRLDAVVQEIAQRRRREKGLGAGPVWNVEGRAGMGAWGGRMPGVMGAKRVFYDPAAHGIDGRDAPFSIDEKVLAAEGAANL
jgi:hypothetical protein